MTQTLSRKLQLLKSTITFDTYVCIQKYQFIMETNICNCTFLLRHSLPTGNKILPFLDFSILSHITMKRKAMQTCPSKNLSHIYMEYGEISDLVHMCTDMEARTQLCLCIIISCYLNFVNIPIISTSNHQ